MSQPPAAWGSLSGLSLENLSHLTLDSFSFDSFDPSAPSPHAEANPSGLRSDAEIAAFATDETLDDVSRALLLLSSPHAVQRHSLVFQLPSLLTLHPEADSVRRVLPPFLQLMREMADDELREAARVLQQLVESRLVAEKEAVTLLLPKMIDFLAPVETARAGTPPSSSAATGAPASASVAAAAAPASTAASAAASAALTASLAAWHSACIGVLSSVLAAHSAQPSVLQALLSFASASSESIHSSSRLGAAQLFGRLAPFAPLPSLLSLLPSALALCQDTGMEVRCAMCGSLPALAAALCSSPPQLQLIAGELTELLQDEELSVKTEALLCSVPLLPLLSPALLSSCLLPVFRTYFSAPPQPLHAVLARVYGPVAHHCSAVIAAEAATVRLMRDFYRQSCSAPEAEVRYWCAFNLPGMLTLLQPPASPLLELSLLSPLLQAFLHDAHQPVRLCIARALPALASLLLSVSAAQMKQVKDAIVVLLKDEDAAVRDAVMAAAPELLKAADSAVVGEVFRALLSLDASLLSYRTRLLHLSCLLALRPHFSTGDLQYHYCDRLTPLLFACLHSAPPAPLLQALTAALNHLLSTLPSSQRRHDLLQRLLRECGPSSRSCYGRLLFLSLVESWLSVFSRRWLRKQGIVAAVCKLAAGETVREVRVRLLQLTGRMERLRGLMDAKEREGCCARLLQGLQADSGSSFSSEKARAWLSGRGEESAAQDEEEERRDREREEREERLQREEEEMLELMLKREQQRERNFILNGGSAANSAALMQIIKQKKEREKDAKDRERMEEKTAAAAANAAPPASAASAAAAVAPLLSPLTPASRERKIVAARLQSRAGSGAAAPPRARPGAAAASTPASAAAEEREEGVEERRERGGSRSRTGYLPGLPSSASFTSSAIAASAASIPVPSQTASTPIAASLRFASPSPSAAAAGKKPAGLLPSTSVHPMSRRYPSSLTSPTFASPSLGSPQSQPLSSGSSASASLASPALVPALSSGSHASPRLTKAASQQLPKPAKQHGAASHASSNSLGSASAATAGLGLAALTGSAMLKGRY